jgi:hypothetical protein
MTQVAPNSNTDTRTGATNLCAHSWLKRKAPLSALRGTLSSPQLIISDSGFLDKANVGTRLLKICLRSGHDIPII